MLLHFTPYHSHFQCCCPSPSTNHTLIASPLHPLQVAFSLPQPFTLCHSTCYCHCNSPCTTYYLIATARHPIPVTLWLPLPFSPVLVTLSLPLPFHLAPVTHPHWYCPSTLYQLHSHCETHNLTGAALPHCTSRTLIATAFHPIPVTLSVPLPFTMYQLHSHCH